MKLLICGDRNWTDKKLIRQEILKRNPSCIIEGEANGADSLSREIGEELNIIVCPFAANWEAYGKSAGPMRNRKMLIEGKPDLVLAFHDSIENSKGTKNMINQALLFNLPVELIGHNIRRFGSGIFSESQAETSKLVAKEV